VNSIELAFEGAWRVLIAGLLFGAGIPVVYALALRALTIGATTTVSAEGDIRVRPSLRGRLLSALLVAVVVGGVALGLMIILAAGMGKTVTFEHLIPTFVDKE
jgi:hypothetical protein